MTGSCFVAQASLEFTVYAKLCGLKLAVLRFLPPRYRDYRCVPPHLDNFMFFICLGLHYTHVYANLVCWQPSYPLFSVLSFMIAYLCFIHLNTVCNYT
jgi:hypothetical protein